ncbi:MAG: DUF4430 domain-containing protein [Eubacteriaceae bacterium]|nr:DUF4430 domain-containing protein [Eubacteriaceae bacterium]
MKRKGAGALTVVILVTVFCLGVIMFVGSSREWFISGEESRIVTSELTGQASLTRRGTGYSLKEGIGLRKGDTVITAMGGGAVFDIEGIGSVTVDGDSSIRITECSDTAAGISAEFGTALFHVNDPDGSFRAASPAGSVTASGETLFSLDAYPGTQTVRVYLGKLSFTPSWDGEGAILLPGDQLTVIQNDDGISTGYVISGISPGSLNGFLLEELMGSPLQTAFSLDELRDEVDRRIRETEDAIAEKEAYEAAILAQGGTVPVITSTKPVSEYMTEQDFHTCTITISCATVLDNMDLLAESLASVIPPDGMILSYSTVEFVEGESVYDVLKRTCAAAGLPLEYSWTVEYGGYYIEAINGLGEFDCGSESGWMYKVNGWFPNYSCSNYPLRDGDVIVWAYTCHGLGADLGLEWAP